jgi:hypothetical protein
MTNSKGSRIDPEPRRRRTGERVSDTRGWDAALRGERGYFEADARTWIADLTAANAALRRGIGARGLQSLSETLERLERLEIALHRAPAQIMEHLGRRTAALASAGYAAAQDRTARGG